MTAVDRMDLLVRLESADLFFIKFPDTAVFFAITLMNR